MQVAAGLRYGLLKVWALCLLACRRPLSALVVFELMLQLRPRDPYVLASHGHVSAQVQLLDQAVDSLTRLTALQPDRAAGWFNLGYVLQQAGRHEEALPAFERAVTLEPGLDRAWYGLALVHIEARRFGEAAEALQKNTALQPLSPYGWYRLVQVWLALDQPAEAKKVLARLRRFEPRVAAQLERDNAAAFAAASDTVHAAH